MEQVNQDTLDYDDRVALATNGNKIAESDSSRVQTVVITEQDMRLAANPLFSYFLDGSRHVYKVDDIAVGNRIFPFLAGQIIVGCCERKDYHSFRHHLLRRMLVLALPQEFNYDNDKESDFCRLYCEKINDALQRNAFVRKYGIQIDKILLYKTDGSRNITEDRDGFKNSGTAKIQAEMTDAEQLMVADLCRENRLDKEHFLIKDGSIEYNPNYSNSRIQLSQLKSNYRHVVGVSKMFNPDLLKDFRGRPLSETIVELKAYERTKVYRYVTKDNETEFAMWYVRLRKGEFRETRYSDVVKCEMLLEARGGIVDSSLVNLISANLIREAYPTCYGKDGRWANHLYPVFLTESYCKSNYVNQNIILNLF